MFKIIKYEQQYEDELMDLIKEEGDDWEIYWSEPNNLIYRKSFTESITYLAMDNGKICGYSRSIKDGLFIYVCDLLVTEKCRGNGLGKLLIGYVQKEYPKQQLYIMSGNDEYYSKLGFKKEGTIYLFK